jgi:uncharacterized repeat protein (TIGR01451 family)
MYPRRLSWVIVFAGVAAPGATQGDTPASAIAGHGPNLSVTIMRPGVDWRPLIAPGQTATISIGVSNLRGDADAHRTTLTVLLPAGLTFKQSSPAPGKITSDKAGTSLAWELGTVPAGAFPQLFNLDLQAANDLKAGKGLGVAAVVSTSDHSVSEVNSRNAIVFRVANAAANLIVQSNLDAVPFTADKPVEFNAESINLGTVSASACMLRMMLPPKAAFQWSEPSPSDQSGNVVTWSLGDLAPGHSNSIKVRIVLDPILRAAAFGFAPKLGSLKIVFDASTTTNQLNPAYGHAEITRFVEAAGSNVTVSLNVVGAEHPGELPVGKDVTYEIVYGNSGNSSASKVSLSLILPDGLALVDALPPATSSSKSDKSGASISSWELGDLAVGQSGIVKSKVHVTSVGADGSLVKAKISAAGADVPSRQKTAYSLRYAAKR